MRFGLLLVLIANPALAETPKGDWLVEDEKAIVHIDTCGTALCGTIVWTKTSGDLDENNPDPARRNRPVVGLRILLGMKPASDGRWEGDIYNPENGKTYTSRMWLNGEDKLRVEGCVLGFLCGGQHWTRTKFEPPAPGAKTRPPKSSTK